MKFIPLMAAFALLTTLMLASPARAHEVEPLIIDLAPSGRGATATMRVTNRDPVPVAVEIYAERRMIDEYGVETRERADDDFILVPAQLRVEPGQTGTFRIRYIGEPVEKSVGYAVTVAQLKLENIEQTGVQILVNFAASVHVVPRNAKSNMTASAAEIVTGSDGKPMVNFVLSNEGNRHQGMAAGKITLTNAAGAEFVLEGDALRETLKHTLIPAMASRRVSTALPEGWPADGPVTVALSVPSSS
jgi:P pilus assembly chaperone PapD